MREIRIEERVDFSVIVPLFNSERFIGQTLDSLIKQQFPYFEVLVINDGSTDKSAEIVNKYFSFDRRIKYVKHEENQGTGGALNTGHRLAKGKYLTWCSSDNVYFSNFLSSLVDAFSQIEREKIPVEFLYGDFIYIDSEGRKIGEVIHPAPQPRQDLVNGYDCGMAFGYTRSLWEKVGDYQKGICEDYDFVCRAACHTNLGLIKEVLGAFRIHKNQISGNRKEEEKIAADLCKLKATRFLNEGRYV